jgi:general nucleoside transport system ATP-binding protein
VTDESAVPLIELRGISKIYNNGIIANQDINLSFRKSEIHAICGENGAGKSTLMKILFGMETPSKGSIIIRGKEAHFSTPDDAISHGIGMVHQHFMLVPSFTTAQNLVLGKEPAKNFHIDHKEMIRITERLSAQYHLPIDATAIVADISVGMKQKLEILKALYRGAEILILDEPTAVLTPQETEELFAELQNLAAMGHTIIFISHKLHEVKAISDRVSILRKGRFEGVFDTASVSREKISRLMVGKEISLPCNSTQGRSGKKLIHTDHLSHRNSFGKTIINDLSFSLHEGTILGIAGVEGNGQQELARILSGLENEFEGDCLMEGTPVQSVSIRELRSLGLRYIPEDRIHTGLAVTGDIRDNLIVHLTDDTRFQHRGVLDSTAIDTFCNSLVTEYDIISSGIDQPVQMLSGGNMQKVVVARECSDAPRVLIAEQPTRGVDVGAASIIHQALFSLRASGTAILLISADLTELLAVCDSLIVLYDGCISAYFNDLEGLEETVLGAYMLGVRAQTPEEIREALHG